jgi:hypothetical protein
MKPDEISRMRCKNQQVVGSRLSSAEEVSKWMVALQAQDYIMSKWAFGIRVPDSTEEMINNEIDAGRIIRTHVLRPTWHFISADDIYWLIAISHRHIRNSMSYREKQLELSDDIFSVCNRILEKSLRDNNHKTREELISELLEEKIRVDENRASHIFMRAEIEGIICSGKQKKGKITYALISDRVPFKRSQLSHEEALKELGYRYFKSRGPATLKDFVWWSGLSAGESRLAIELNKHEFSSIESESQTYWFSDSEKKEHKTDQIFFLPSYDELLISYRDRNAVINDIDHKTAVSNNGIFYPSIMINGRIAGTWKRNIKGRTVFISTNLFENENTDLSGLFEKSLSAYSRFINKKVELITGK